MSCRPSVLCTVDLSMAPEALEILSRTVELEYRPGADRSVLLSRISECEAYWGHVDLRIDRQVLKRAGKLKVINTASTGTDHIDVEEASRQGVRILSITRDYGLLNTFTATAECAWMLLLACQRHLRTAVRSVLEGRWNGEELTGRQLSESTLGVLGMGRLGKMVAEYGKAFRMQVLGCDTREFRVKGVQPVGFEALLDGADAISIHVHMTPENYHLFDARALGRMKRGAVLVNTSRGDVVDEEALVDALETGRLAAYGADVLHDEWRADMRESPLVRYALDHENVVITPHVGGCTTRSLVDARVFSARKLAHYLETGEEITMP